MSFFWKIQAFKAIVVVAGALFVALAPVASADAAYPGERIVNGVVGFVQGRADGVRRRVERRQNRRAEGRGLARLGFLRCR